MRTCLAALALAALSLTTPTIALAESYYTRHSGATCIPSPHNDPSSAAPYQSVLYGFGNQAFCHIVVPNGWSLSQLGYVTFTAHQGGANPMRFSLCVTDLRGGAPTCGPERTTVAGMNDGWVVLPSPLPPGTYLAYVQIRFPAGETSRIFGFVPVFFRP